jgi:hypothetical protein
MGLDTKTYWLTDRQSQCNFHFDFDFDLSRGEWWLKTRSQKDFIVIWTASFCVEIRCQETTSEDLES